VRLSVAEFQASNFCVISHNNGINFVFIMSAFFYERILFDFSFLVVCFLSIKNSFASFSVKHADIAAPPPREKHNNN